MPNSAGTALIGWNQQRETDESSREFGGGVRTHF